MAAAKAPRKAAKKAAAKKAAPAKKTSTVKKAAATKGAPGKKAAKSAAPRRPANAPPIVRTRVVIPMDVYEPRKDEFKAPLKAASLKWNFLGEGKGLYKREDNGVHAFTQFKDDGVHYSVWGSDEKARDGILAAWRALLGEEGWKKATTSGEEAVAAEKAQVESEALRVWRLAEPQRRPGEPDLFYTKRVAEWQAKKPA